MVKLFHCPAEWLNNVDGNTGRTLGGSNSRPTPKGKCDEVEVQYPLALASALIEASKKPADHVCHVVKIRFLFISGTFSVRDQTKSLWMLEEGRKARVRIRLDIPNIGY